MVYDDNVDDNEADDDDEQLDDIEFKEYMEKRGNGAGAEPAKNGQQAKPAPNNKDANNTSVNKGKKKVNNNNANNSNGQHNNDADKKQGGAAGGAHPRVNLRPPEENKENKVLENNYVSEEKKLEKSRDVLTSVEINDADTGLDQQNQGDENSPRNAANQNKNKGDKTNKNDISIISSSVSKEKNPDGTLPKVVKKNPSITSNPVIPAPSGTTFLPQIGNPGGNNSANYLNNKEPPAVPPKNPVSNAPKLPPPNNPNNIVKNDPKMLKSNIAAVAIYSSSNKKKKS